MRAFVLSFGTLGILGFGAHIQPPSCRSPAGLEPRASPRGTNYTAWRPPRILPSGPSSSGGNGKFVTTGGERVWIASPGLAASTQPSGADDQAPKKSPGLVIMQDASRPEGGLDTGT
jgi:hypothetical protein